MIQWKQDMFLKQLYKVYSFMTLAVSEFITGCMEVLSRTDRSHMVCITPQYCSGTANHSVSPGPMLMLIEQKLLFS